MLNQVPVAINVVADSNQVIMNLLCFFVSKTTERYRIRVLIFPNDEGVNLLSLFGNEQVLNLDRKSVV